MHCSAGHVSQRTAAAQGLCSPRGCDIVQLCEAVGPHVEREPLQALELLVLQLVLQLLRAQPELRMIGRAGR